MSKKNVVLLLVGVVLVIAVGAYAIWTSQSDLSSNVPNSTESGNEEKTYESPDRVLSFKHSADVSIQPITTAEVESPVGQYTVTYPEGSVEVPGLFVVSRIPYGEISKEKPIIDFYNCCSGARYWYDVGTNTLQAEKMQMGEYTSDGTNLPEKVQAFPLATNGNCTVKQSFGSRSFYKIESGDEGIPTDVYYFLLTDKGYAIRFLSRYDLQKDYSTYAFEYRPDSGMLEAASELLSSVSLGAGVSEITPNCI